MRPVREFCFTAAGSMTDPEFAAQLAVKYQNGTGDRSLLAPAGRYWKGVTRNLRITGGGREGAALDLLVPWLAHNAIIHLTVPHGLEQYTGAAWGTRDVCQGPVEFLLALEHDEPVKQILWIVFAQQYETQGDWPQCVSLRKSFLGGLSRGQSIHPEEFLGGCPSWRRVNIFIWIMPEVIIHYTAFNSNRGEGEQWLPPRPPCLPCIATTAMEAAPHRRGVLRPYGSCS